MPFYEYECPSCRYYLEVLQKISDPPVKKCPSCGKSGFKRLMSAPVFRLKGSGWYETDFKSDKEGQRNLAGAEPKEAKVEAPEAAAPKAGADDKAAKAETPASSGESAKAERSAPAAGSKRSSKSSGAAARSPSAKRGSKRPAARSRGKSSPKAKRGSRRR